ncbi:hypothetical protein HBI56_165050 [Parastagonospora nodorum]|uniref:Uncharacterized protein n=2 Tax=Phaeosphaeria nodorum (strain SN15 / ATCC MYA-4574 / FGSC 10173) TaxID=321614 RepID=A0A7U2NQF0_PHANO|nr:hypothetical protein SNOG_13552 [Parastagonospora nodorum SN15]KAH3915333.1 hypothetical protein HBH56_072800 [Parastagonospora nodorum]EAT78999.2 hypothetical protein SNOG_13552 [Parastagonospora nodorum SN15]KAH3927290.1 hypothetical protein HBH54_153040 [Parastagonospora nodorum]KAH3952109.1 hypothetical protein HBH53_055330 [Parastagonospora nodorum]KAH3983214.1 hypothetical protein HBH52_067390 [Parastagonospora nodorum]
MATTISPSAAARPTNIKDALEVLLLCFEAAADALPPFPLAYAMAVAPEATPTNIPSLVIWQIEDLKTKPPSYSDFGSLCASFPPQSLPAALARWNMCDYFAILLIDEVRKKMDEYFGAEVDWWQIVPRPELGLFTCNEEKFLPRGHSVLVITEANGVVSVMDGTPEQFHWDRSTWLLLGNDFQARIGGIWGINSEAHMRQCEDSLGLFPKGHWSVARKRMNVLFGELDWSLLFLLSSEDRTASVKAQAQLAFAGMHRIEETLE